MRFRTAHAYFLAAVIAFLAALHKILYASVLVNDDFMHRAYALQLLNGELPVRDFYDYGMVLMYLASAVAQLLFGYRLLAEALLIGLTVGVSSSSSSNWSDDSLHPTPRPCSRRRCFWLPCRAATATPS